LLRLQGLYEVSGNRCSVSWQQQSQINASTTRFWQGS
jgi:hypothetical protein